MCRVFISTALVLFLSVQGPAAAQQDTDRLTEQREMFANAIQPPKAIMDLIGVRPGLVIGEVGAGRGRVTVHLADRVGAKGRIYANDINAAAASLCKRSAGGLAPASGSPAYGDLTMRRASAIIDC